MRRANRQAYCWDGENGRIFVGGDPGRSAVRERTKQQPQAQNQASVWAILAELGKVQAAFSSKGREGEAQDERPCREKKVGPIIRAHGANYLATFRELYRSRDGGITVFEDGDGHITSVDSSRLV